MKMINANQTVIVTAIIITQPGIFFTATSQIN